MSVGAVAMNSSTIIVAVNAQLLRRLRLQRDTTLNSSHANPHSDGRDTHRDTQ